MTAYFLANGGPRQSLNGDGSTTEAANAWLAAIEAAQVKDVAGADRLAWLAYQRGDMPATRRWLERADPTSAIAEWIQAKLLLRDGRIEEASRHLASASKRFPRNEEWNNLNDEHEETLPEESMRPAGRAMAELGMLHLGRGQYVDSLDALLRSGFWLDAAYVAERVLTVDELKTYVDRNWKALSPARETAVFKTDDDLTPSRVDSERTTVNIRHLLARRLARLQRHREAREYYPRQVQTPFDLYVTSRRLARDAAQSASKRADALWQAARIARRSGLELLASELEPDWAVVGGQYELDDAFAFRSGQNAGRFTRVTGDEAARVRASRIEPAHRWYYRYLAADLAWQAAELMPDDSDETARVLAEGGSWIKTSAPREADRFYQALVRRCGHTELGRAAARLHWFP